MAYKVRQVAVALFLQLSDPIHFLFEVTIIVALEVATTSSSRILQSLPVQGRLLTLFIHLLPPFFLLLHPQLVVYALYLLLQHLDATAGLLLHLTVGSVFLRV